MSPSSGRSKRPRRFPLLIALDVLGTLLLVAGLLGALDVDVGLPVLADAWPFLVVLGTGLMAPLLVGIVLAARHPDR